VKKSEKNVKKVQKNVKIWVKIWGSGGSKKVLKTGVKFGSKFEESTVFVKIWVFLAETGFRGTRGSGRVEISVFRVKVSVSNSGF